MLTVGAGGSVQRLVRGIETGAVGEKIGNADSIFGCLSGDIELETHACLCA